MNVMQEFKRHFHYMILSFIFAIAIDMLALIPPVIMSIIIDRVIPDGDFSKALLLIGLFISIPVLNGCVYAVYNTWGAMMCRKAAYRINRQVIDAILWQPMRFHTEKSSAKLATECSRSAIDYTYIWIQTIPRAIATLVTAIIAFCYLFGASKWIAVSQLLLIPITLIATVFVRRIISKYSKILFDAVNAIQSMLIENFRAIKTVKNFGLENNVLQKYNDCFRRVDKIFKKEVWIESFQGDIAMQFLMSLFVGIAFVLGAFEVSKGTLTIGMLVSSLTFINKYQTGIMSFMSTNLNFAKQLSTFETLFEYQGMSREGKNSTYIPDAFLDNKILVENLSFSYDGEKNVLQNFNMVIARNTWVGISGRSGIGKSTLLDILTRIEDSKKSVFIDGVDISTIDLTWYRKNIAVVSQFPYIFRDTVRNNFRLVNNSISDVEILKYLQMTCVRNVIEALPNGLDTVLGEDAQLLSGGEKQRLAIAIAIASKRRLLILDEATSNLDEKLELHVANELHKLIGKGELTIISVSHKAGFHRYCDTIIELA